MNSINEKARKIFIDCLNELYENSIPSITWKEIEKKYVDVEGWYLKHVISETKYEAIVAKYKKMLTPQYRRLLNWELLNYAPKVVT